MAALEKHWVRDPAIGETREQPLAPRVVSPTIYSLLPPLCPALG